MIATPIPLSTINNAIREVCFAVEKINYRRVPWTSKNEDVLWRELVACILGSRVRYEIANSALERMERRGLFCESRRSFRFFEYEQDIIEALSERSGTSEPGRYPFFRVRAKQIRQAAERFYGRKKTLRSVLDDSHDVRQARRSLASEVPGLGPKQASLFLRNIGYAPRVAVLDIHILTYMNWVRLIETPMKSVPTLRKYEALEDAFVEHACSFGYAPECFDIAVWVVVRVVKKEQKKWE